MLANNGIKANEKASLHIKDYAEFLYKTRNKFFGNARSMRKVVEEAIKNQHLRLAKIETAGRSKEMIYELVYDDVAEFIIDPNATADKRTIGFK